MVLQRLISFVESRASHSNGGYIYLFIGIIVHQSNRNGYARTFPRPGPRKAVARAASVVALPLTGPPISIDEFQLRDVNPSPLTSPRHHSFNVHPRNGCIYAFTYVSVRYGQSRHACLHALRAKLLAKHGYL